MTIHIFLTDDWIEHKVDKPAAECDCPCNPNILYLHPGTGLPFPQPMVFHQAIDKSPIKNTDPVLSTREIDD